MPTVVCVPYRCYPTTTTKLCSCSKLYSLHSQNYLISSPFTVNVGQLLPYMVIDVTVQWGKPFHVTLSPMGLSPLTDSNLMVTLTPVLEELRGACSSPGLELDMKKDKPDRRGYLPVRKAARLGVHTDAAAMCWVSLMPSSARRSIFGVLQKKILRLSFLKHTERLFQKHRYRKSAHQCWIQQSRCS